jgi:hypothetical protein
MPTITIRTHQDAIAAVPHLLGFHPTESLVLMPFSPELPVVRVDIPTTPKDRDALWEQSLQDALGTHALRADGRARMGAICFTQDRDNAEATGQDIARRLGDIGIGVPVRLWTNGFVWSEFNTGDSGCCSQEAADRMAATGVVAGRVRPAASREAMAATLIGDRRPVATQLDQAYATADTPAAEREWALQRLEEFLDDGTRLTDHDAARLLVAVQTTSTRDALWEEMALENSAAHQALWVDMTRRAPDEVRAPAASLAAFASWLSGDGAKAWCALDEVPTGQNYPMAAIVAGALDGALPPSEWEHRRNLITGLSAGLDLDELDESYIPGTTSAPAPERSSPQSQRPPGPGAPDR